MTDRLIRGNRGSASTFAEGSTPKLTHKVAGWDAYWGLRLHIKHRKRKKAGNAVPNLEKFTSLCRIVLHFDLATRRSGAYPSTHCRPLRRAHTIAQTHTLPRLTPAACTMIDHSTSARKALCSVGLPYPPSLYTQGEFSRKSRCPTVPK